jgi:tyrosyl-DNA phosphodiesterase 2
LFQVKSIGRLPYKIYDVWEKTGRNPETRFSWDCSMNDNLDMDCDFKPRIRFDRIYVRPSKPRAVLKPVKFEFVGMERLEECEMFISDHWGLLAQFDKVSPTL